MLDDAGVAAVVDEPLTQQQLREPMPRRGQVLADILTRPDHIPRGLLGHTRDRDRDDLGEV